MKTKGLMPVIEKKDKAVSPIIATILLVAITVILASTLYLALTGFFTTSSTNTAPKVSLGEKNITTGSVFQSYKITISSVGSNNIAYSSAYFELSLNSGLTIKFTFSSGNYTVTGSTTEWIANVLAGTTSGSTISGDMSSGDTLYLYVPHNTGVSSLAVYNSAGQMGVVNL